jgi:hypothetical protein
MKLRKNYPHISSITQKTIFPADDVTRACPVGCATASSLPVCYRLEEVYMKVLFIISDMSRTMLRLCDTEFMTMILVDDCFMLQFIHSKFVGSHYQFISEDIFLLFFGSSGLVL